ncbi:MAG TPA: hypothetical protein VFD71_21045, partial [Planctomycetota bacterium]|nr:hypothetical protein [Planctomycetota bacterium]
RGAYGGLLGEARLRSSGVKTKKTPLAEIEACIKQAVEKAMSPEHIKQLKALRKVVGRGGAMAMASPYIFDTTAAEIERYRRAQSCPVRACTMQEQLCRDLAEEGNPDFVLSPLGLVPNPCKPSLFSSQPTFY